MAFKYEFNFMLIWVLEHFKSKKKKKTQGIRVLLSVSLVTLAAGSSKE